jgi:hypothetical protein
MLTEGALGGPWQGDTDVCLGRFDATGAKLWLRQIGSDSLDSSTGLAPDGAGGVYFGGWTLGAFGGSTFGNFGHQWASRYDTSGTQLSLAQFGSQALGFTHTFASDGAGGVYIGGETSSPLGGPHSQVGAVDAFVARYTDACPPVTTYCTASATSIPGCQASISTGGTPHLSDGLAFTLSSGAVPGGNLGLCLFGWNGPASLPLGSLGGSLCVQSPLFRSAPHAGGGLAGQCNGQLTFTLQDLIDAAPAFSAGTALNAQLWVRDAANPDSFLLSNGVQFTVCL